MTESPQQRFSKKKGFAPRLLLCCNQVHKTPVPQGKVISRSKDSIQITYLSFNPKRHYLLKASAQCLQSLIRMAMQFIQNYYNHSPRYYNSPQISSYDNYSNHFGMNSYDSYYQPPTPPHDSQETKHQTSNDYYEHLRYCSSDINGELKNDTL